MGNSEQHIRRVPVVDLKKQQDTLLRSSNLVEDGYTGQVVLKLNYHRGSLNSMQMDKSISL